MAQRILIVDDEIDLLEILAFNLQKAGFEVATASSGLEAICELQTQPASLVLLDVMMSGMDGFQTARKLRESGNSTPIIFLTAKDTENDLLEGFSAGADDYISKPFSVREVVARVKAVLLRSPQSPSRLRFESIEIDTTNKATTINGEPLSLTKTEFAILETLIKKPCKVFSREELIAKVWGADVYIEERTVDVHIARLRKKMGEQGSLIINRSGYGYCIDVDLKGTGAFLI